MTARSWNGAVRAHETPRPAGVDGLVVLGLLLWELRWVLN